MDDVWQFQNPVAELRRGVLTGRVDVSQPELGLHGAALNGQALDARLLCIGSEERQQAPSSASAWPVADAYVRGSDLVATYRPQDDWPFSPQVYWQANAPQSMRGAVGCVSLSISVQTHLLDTWPRMSVQSQVVADETLLIAPDDARDRVVPLGRGLHTAGPSIGATCVLRRLRGHELCYAEIMPANDFREVGVRWEADGSCQTRWRLFADFLEKGVIWRARLQSVVLPRANDVELAMACCRAFQQRPLPLTT